MVGVNRARGDYHMSSGWTSTSGPSLFTASAVAGTREPGGGDEASPISSLGSRAAAQTPRRLFARLVASLLAAVMTTTVCSCAKPLDGTPSEVPTPAESSASSTPQVEPPTRRKPSKKTGPLGVPGTWTLDWRDEFSGNSVNLKRWRPNWLANSDTAVTTPINEAELSCYDPANATVKNGTLRLKAEKQACRTHDGKTYDYTSGIVESAHDYQFTYGLAEARIYLPPSDGSLAPKGSCGPNWGVFMLNGRHHPEDGEIDVMECLSDSDVSWHYHYGSDAAPRENGGYPEAWRGDMPGSSGWHTFGVDWEPGRLVFYYDGVEVGVHESGVTSKPHYLVAALAISGSAAATPQTMQVDYIRVWKRER
jgi:beta-glucanase (GH16 family)